LQILVGNAIKYAGDGSTIEIKTWDDEEWVYIEISDNGVGIKEDLDRIYLRSSIG
jgi:signal transduction histidine kinase